MHRVVVFGGDLFAALLALRLSRNYSVAYVAPAGVPDFSSVQFPLFSPLSPVHEGSRAELPVPSKTDKALQTCLKQCRELEVRRETVSGFLAGDSEQLRATESYFSERPGFELRNYTGEAVSERLPLVANFVSSLVEISGLKKLTFENLAASLENRTELIQIERPQPQLTLARAGESGTVEAVELSGRELPASEFLFIGPGNDLLRGSRPELCPAPIEREQVVTVQTGLSASLEFEHPVLSDRAGFYPLTPRRLQLVKNVGDFAGPAKLASGKLLELLHEACEIFPCLYEAEFKTPEISFNRWPPGNDGIIDEQPIGNVWCVDGYGSFELSFLPDKLRQMEAELE